MKYRFLIRVLLLSGILAEALGAAKTQPSASRSTGMWQTFGSLRVRQERWTWFDSPSGDHSYSFTGSLLRLGTTRTTPSNDVTLELSAPVLLWLPRNASAPPPQGQLGLGASYRDASGSQETNVFLKQAFVRFKGRGSSLRLGRFEFIDGTETVPSNPSLAWMKRERIAHRVIGNFGWSHVQRSFDGIHSSQNRGGANMTLFGGFPTRGVFDLRAMDSLTDVKTVYAAFSKSGATGDARVFALYYDDSRDPAVKPDNRPLTTRQADREPVKIGTIGGHLMAVQANRAGTLDGLLWAAGQFGDWGALDHRGFAAAAEIGYQPAKARFSPWYRLGYYHASGDDDAKDNSHTTYFPGMPTPRIYARFPFYSLANLHDLFVQALLRPSPKLTLRLDAHRLSLDSRADGWYAGGGAFNGGPAFGYTLRPSGGRSGLADVMDMSADYQVSPQTVLGLYFAYANGSAVVRNIYDGRTATLGYLELSHRW